MDFEIDEIRPGRDPVIEQTTVLALHDLVAAGQIGGHPTVDVAKPVRCQSALLAEAIIDGTRIAVAEILDDEEEHGVTNQYLLERLDFRPPEECYNP